MPSSASLLEILALKVLILAMIKPVVVKAKASLVLTLISRSAFQSAISVSRLEPYVNQGQNAAPTAASIEPVKLTGVMTHAILRKLY